jgi:GNAT superfamily N-acetyltransferase
MGWTLGLPAQSYDAAGLVRSSLGRRRLLRAVRVRMFSRSEAFGLRRDLSVPFPVPSAKIPLIVRPLRPDDDLSFLAPDPGLAPDAARGRLDQRRLLAADVPTCWIAAEADGTVCYMQWLIAARDNARVRARWRGLFPQLQPDEALLEGAYTAESHRGQGIMSHAMARIAEHAGATGAHHVITFVDHRNVASLKGCERAGFAPYVKRSETWFLFHRRVRFRPLENPGGPNGPAYSEN